MSKNPEKRISIKKRSVSSAAGRKTSVLSSTSKEILGMSPYPTPEEREQVEILREQIKPVLEAYDGEIHPEMHSDMKLIRYIRGHRGNALQAFKNHLAYRKQRKVDQVRAALIDFEKENGQLPWPYFLPKFSKIVDGLWKGVIPSTHHGYSEKDGSIITFTMLVNYDFNGLLKNKLDQLWIELALHCDVYFDILQHRLSEEQGRPVSRHDIVDVKGTKMGHLNLSVIGYVYVYVYVV